MFKTTDSQIVLAGGSAGSVTRKTVGDLVQRVKSVDVRAVDNTGGNGDGARSGVFSNLLKDFLSDVQKDTSSGLARQPVNNHESKNVVGDGEVILSPGVTVGQPEGSLTQVSRRVSPPYDNSNPDSNPIGNSIGTRRDPLTFRDCFLPYEQTREQWPVCGDGNDKSQKTTVMQTKEGDRQNDSGNVSVNAPSRPRILTLERAQLIDEVNDSGPIGADHVASVGGSDTAGALRQGNGRPGNQQLEQLVRDSGEFHGVDPNLALAVAYAESSLRVDAVSRDGHDTKGLFQLMDSTANDMREHLGLAENYRPFDPKHNAFLGTGYMKFLFDSFNSETALNTGVKTIPVNDNVMLERTVLAAYNCGLGTVARAQNRVGSAEDWEQLRNYLPSTTVSYVERVMALKQNFANQYNNLSPKMNALA